MEKDKYDYLLKYIIIGDSGVGKSNIFLQFIKSTFKSSHEVTIGVEFGAKNIQLNNTTYRIQIWDTAGQETFKSITRVYYKNSACAFLVYDITNKDTFYNIQTWMNDCIAQTPQSVILVLVGNKKDLANERQVSYEEGKEFAETHGIRHFFECSAKENENIKEAFDSSLNEIDKKIKLKFYDLNSDTCGVTPFTQKKGISLSGSTFKSKHTNNNKGGYLNECC